MKLKSATKFTLFSTVMMTLVNLFFLIFALSFLYDRLGEIVNESIVPLLSVMLVLVAGTALVAYFISSLVVDRILNPVRTMSAKVREIGDRHYTERLSIDSEEDELREYVSTFNDMAIKINRYIDKQKRFVSDASHELATPITIINGHADMLLRWGKDEPDTLTESLSVIKNEALRMNGLIENLLFFARSDNNRQPYHFTLNDMRGLLEGSVAEARQLYPSHEFTLRFDGEHESRCDADALRRVFRILFENAVKYGTGDNHVDVSAEFAVEGWLSISVSDHGPGIPEAHWERVFDRFFRVDDSRAKQTGGSGLGLSISKEIVDRHGGKIKAGNATGGGALFTIELP